MRYRAVELADVVVIGSGFGGAVPAFHLAEAGASVVVLERGPRVSSADLDRERALTRWNRLYDVILGTGIITLAGNCVGGGSMHYYAVSLRAPAFAFDRCGSTGRRLWPGSISREALDPWYERVEQALPVAKLGWDDISEGGEVLSAACRLAGRACSPVPLAVDLPGCTNCGRMDAGCPSDAKRSMALTYLPAAEAAGAQVRPLHEAQRIGPAATPGYRYRIEYDTLDGSRYRPVSHDVIEAKVIVVAAGAMASPVLLQRSAAGLGGIPMAVGRHFSPNGDLVTSYFMCHNPARPATKPYGKAITAMLTDRLDPELPQFSRHCIQDAYYPLLDDVMAALHATRHTIGRTRLLAAHRGTIQTTLSMYEDDNEGVFGQLPQRGAFKRLSRGIARSSLRYRSNAHSQAAIAAVEGDLHAILGRSGGRFVRVPFTRNMSITGHPLSSCRLGDDLATAALDSRHELRGHPGLFVTDGSAVPAALCVNPSLTIAALAERASPFIIESLAATGAEVRYRASLPSGTAGSAARPDLLLQVARR